MDPNPKNHPILSYVMSKLPSIGPKWDTADIDIEQPRELSPTAKAPYFELTEQMPHLTDPKVIADMGLAVSEVYQTRSMLKILGDRPDHESVDTAKLKLAEIESKLSKQMEEIALSPRPSDVGTSHQVVEVEEDEDSPRKAAEKEMQIYKAVISLEEMHETYGKLLKDAEERLEKIYEKAAAGARGGAEVEDSEDISEEVNEEVVGILRDASGKGVDRIDLSGRGLRFLPEAFGMIRTMRMLNLSSNNLQVIPDSVAGLENLEELNISSNLLESLPDSIGLLLNLKVLDVSRNKLTALPDSICHCRSLVELDASFNRLTYLPTNIGYELVNLKKLSINLNKIRTLPTSIGEMNSLSHLDVHFNELRSLPDSIGRLNNLESLNLSSNFSDLCELPNALGDLVSLKELDLSNNQIHSLPVTFGCLENLTNLNLAQNPIVVPPKEVVDKGVEAVKKFMAKRRLYLEAGEEEEEEKESTLGNGQTQTGWLTSSLSSVKTFVLAYTAGGGNSNADPLDQQL